LKEEHLRNLQDENIAHSALTNSKRPSCFVEGVYPTHIKKAFKCYLEAANGRTYIDYICALGTNLFGYSNPAINQAVADAMNSGGSVYSLASDSEAMFADRFVDEMPFIEKVRFLKCGSSGCSAAIKIARAFTGRKKILSEGYHGWHDAFVSLTPPAKGVVGSFDIESFTRGTQYPETLPAAIILEPVMLVEDRKRLQDIREWCDRHDVLLIFDETITAYRYKDGCVAKALNIHPDIWVGGKAIAGGLPLSIVGGKRDIMESDYFVSSTWGGDRVAIYAANKVIDLIHGEYDPNSLWEMGSEFLEKFNEISSEVQIEGYATRGAFKYQSEEFKALFMQEMCLAGVLIGPSWFYNKDLHAEMDNVLDISKHCVKRILEGKVSLKGKMPQSPFADKVRKNV
jgi:glutamate-1-semialdehyde aminotransferase